MISLPGTQGNRDKVLHVKTPRVQDVGLIDAVLMRNDHVGNLLPFDADRIGQLVLTRAEPDAIGMSPIGGLIQVVTAQDDCGLLVDIDPEAEPVTAPLSPGLFGDVHVGSVTEIGLDVAVPMRGPGVIGFPR